MLVTNKSVQTELKFTEKQLKLIEDRQKKQRELFGQIRQLPPEEIQGEFNKFNKTNEQVITKALTPKQAKRLSEISIQQRGVRALTDPEVAKALVLSGAQKKSIEDIQSESRETMQAQITAMMAQGGRGFGGPGGQGGAGGAGGQDGGPGRRGGDGQPGGAGGDGGGRERSAREEGDAQPPAADAKPAADGANPGDEPPRREGRVGGRGQISDEQRKAFEESREKMTELRTSTEEKMLAVLTTKQQTKWKEIQGEPFKLEMSQGGRGRRGGRDEAEKEKEAEAKTEKAAEKPAATRPKAAASKSSGDKLPARPR